MHKSASVQKSSINVGQGRVPTADGMRIGFKELIGTESEQQLEKTGTWFLRFREKLSLFLAGMYTGIGCSGVPHSHHTYGHDRDKGPV
jgi:hypothetical protein